MLDRVMETVSPWVTVIVGLGLVDEAFQAVKEPISTIGTLAAWTSGTAGSTAVASGLIPAPTARAIISDMTMHQSLGIAIYYADRMIITLSAATL